MTKNSHQQKKKSENTVHSIFHIRYFTDAEAHRLVLAQPKKYQQHISCSRAWLADRFGVRFGEIQGSKIREIIRSDKIRTKTEFSTLFEYVETHYENESKKDLIDQINVLLARYEEKHR